MAYTPHDWQTGEVITEELLDHMEEGIEEGVTGNATVFNVVNNSEANNQNIDATWQEVHDAILTGPVFLKNIPENDVIMMQVVTSVYLSENGYEVAGIISNSTIGVVNFSFIAETPNSYPIYPPSR